MPRYVILMNLTEQGIKNIKKVAQRIEESVKELASMGGRLIDSYTVMGEYDYVVVAEAPDDKIIATYLLKLGATGNVRTKTLKAFTKEEFTEIVKKL